MYIDLHAANVKELNENLSLVLPMPPHFRIVYDSNCSKPLIFLCILESKETLL
jgi:hypothetical protein